MELLSREASPSSTLAWEEVSIGRAETSALWDGDMTASMAAAFSVVECSDSQLESTMPCFSKASTSALRVILGFQGVLGVVIAGIGLALPNGGVAHSGSSGKSRRMSIPYLWVFISSDSRTAMQLFWRGDGNWLVTPI